MKLAAAHTYVHTCMHTYTHTINCQPFDYKKLAAAHTYTHTYIHTYIHAHKQLTTLAGDSTMKLAAAEPVNATATGGDAAGGPPKVLGATGSAVFGGANSTVSGFLGFSKVGWCYFVCA